MPVFEASSALGGVGLSSGLAGPDLPTAAKAVLMCLMWLGRLEIVPALVLVRTLLTGARSVATR